jgi:hypothetical protein
VRLLDQETGHRVVGHAEPGMPGRREGEGPAVEPLHAHGFDAMRGCGALERGDDVEGRGLAAEERERREDLDARAAAAP